MTGVVLRCPNCGTVQAGAAANARPAARRRSATSAPTTLRASGWTRPACPQCGARFGDPVPAREAPRPPERPASRPPRTVEPRPDFDATGDDAGPWGGGGGGPAGRPGPGGGRPPAPDLAGLVAAMLGAAARSRRGRGERPAYEEPAPRRRRGGGCVGRLLMLALLLFALFLMVPVLLGALLNFG